MELLNPKAQPHLKVIAKHMGSRVKGSTRGGELRWLLRGILGVATGHAPTQQRSRTLDVFRRIDAQSSYRRREAPSRKDLGTGR